ncbi:MAG: RNA methyltransferase [Flavipsychrobacter sp.]
MEELERKTKEEMQRSDKQPIIVILDDVRSMHNVGSAFRTSDAFNISAIFLCGYTPAPPHRDIHKTALGATETVSWKHFSNTKEAIHEAKERGYKIIAIEQVHNSIALNQFNWNKEPIALVFGNEVTGVSEDALKLAEQSIEIPQWGSKHSLNISVSIGVVLWELVRFL